MFFFFLEDKLITLNITSNEIEPFMEDGNLAHLRKYQAMESKFNSNLIPERMKILGYYTKHSAFKLELNGDNANLSASELDFNRIQNNTGYIKQNADANVEGASDFFSEVISSKNYSNEIDFVLFTVIDIATIEFFGFDYHSTKFTMSKYEINIDQTSLNQTTLNFTHKLLEQKTVPSKGKKIKFASILNINVQSNPKDKIYLLELDEDFKIYLNRIDIKSLAIEKSYSFELGEFFGCPQKN